MDVYPGTEISPETFNFIIEEEVTSKSAYEKLYRHPTWPGGASGATIAIGYDLGYTTHQTLIEDWSGLIPGPMIGAMTHAIGVHGSPAHALAHELASQVDIPWDA